MRSISKGCKKFESMCTMMKFVVSPLRSNTPPSYIECVALEMANALSPTSSMSRIKHDLKVSTYVDLEAKETIEDIAYMIDMDCETSPILRT